MSASSKHAANVSVTALLATTFAALLLWHAATAPAAAQEAYPSRLVRMIVPFPAGGTADVLPRIVGEKLSDKRRQPVIIENRAGAGGNIGAEAVANSPADGYVLLASPPGPIAINDNLYKKLGFEPAKFEPVIVLGTVPNVLVVKPTFPRKAPRSAPCDGTTDSATEVHLAAGPSHSSAARVPCSRVPNCGGCGDVQLLRSVAVHEFLCRFL